MKLRNKKTGAIYEMEDIDLVNDGDGICVGMTKYNSLAELNKEWEDYEDSKDFYYIQLDGFIHWVQCNVSDYDRGGVYIKNLYKVFSDNRNFSTHIVFTAPLNIKEGQYNVKDLDLLFGGKQ